MSRKPKILLLKYSFDKDFKNKFLWAANKVGIDLDLARWNQIVVDTATQEPENMVTIAGKRLADYDLIYIRSIKEMYYELTQVTNIANYLGIRIVDKALSKGNRVANLKIHQTTQAKLHGINVPRTVYATDTKLITETGRFGSWPLVLKVMGLHRGEGVFLVHNKTEIRKIMDKYIKTKRSKNFILQEVVDYVADYRILVVGNRVLGAIQRIPKPGEFRANVSRGGGATAVRNLSPKLEKLALKATKMLDLDIAGVDFMEDKKGNYLLTEINRAPGYKGFQEATNINVRVEILKYLKSLILSSSKAELENH